jgi:prepilin-type processing-associated H-X9-DG protein
MKTQHNAHPTSGFTRKEILTVITLAVLALAVILPFLHQRARAAAQAASLQNLRQWGIALNLYLVENNHNLPAAGFTDEDPGAWFNVLPPYLSLPSLHGATAGQIDTQSIWTDPAADLPADGAAASRVTYGMNIWLQPSPAAPSWRIYDIEDPSATLFLVETAPGQLQSRPGQIAYRHGPKPPHPDARAHALFCDGHVEILKRKTTEQPEAANPQANPPHRPTWIPFFQAPTPPGS